MKSSVPIYCRKKDKRQKDKSTGGPPHKKPQLETKVRPGAKTVAGDDGNEFLIENQF